MDLKDMPINFILTSLVIICIVVFAGGIAVQYGYPRSLMTSSYVDTTAIETQVNSTSNSANGWMTSFQSDNLFVALGGIVLFSIWGIMKLIIGSILAFLAIYFSIFSSLFGIPAIITGSITATIIIAIIFLAWRAVKLGW
jgi:hypothetical protein